MTKHKASLEAIKQTATQFRSSWSENRFWKKIGGGAKAIGRNATYNSLVLYQAAKSPETPVWARTVMWGALGYFISLIDAIPDLTPVLGYTDDISLMVAAIAALAAHITPEIKTEALNKTNKIFGSETQSTSTIQPTTPSTSDKNSEQT